MRVRFLLVLLVPLLLTACGISGNLRHHPGYADFDAPRGPGIDRAVGISLGPLPLAFARRFVDAEERRMLRGVDAVRVYVYEVEHGQDAARGQMEELAARLERGGWEPLVSVRQDGELVRAFASMDGPEAIDGLAVIVVEPDEIVMVNLIGDLRPEYFNQYMTGLEIDAPSVAITVPEEDQLAEAPSP